MHVCTDKKIASPCLTLHNPIPLLTIKALDAWSWSWSDATRRAQIAALVVATIG